MVEKTGLVLEGGGLRGIYNAGVMDRFMELELEFDYAVGSSAGAANVGSYLSRQMGRTKRISVNYMTTPNFYSFRNLVRGRPYMDLEYLFKDVTLTLDPLDQETLAANPARWEVTATNIKTGKCVYFNKDEDDMLKAMEASCALPLWGQKPVKYKKYRLLDGGLADPIPVRRAVEQGFKKLVVILTKPQGYRKKSGMTERYLSLVYRKHPKFVKMIKKRYKHYNAQLEYIRNPPEGVKNLPIHPSAEPPVGRLTRDKEKLKETWELGYRDTKKLEKKLITFLG